MPSLGGPGVDADLAAITDAEAMRLFAERAAAVKTAPKTAKPELTKTSMNRIIAAELAKAAAAMLAKWSPARTGVPAELAAQSVASWLNYSPVRNEDWPESLPARSGAGGRGAKNRQSA